MKTKLFVAVLCGCLLCALFAGCKEPEPTPRPKVDPSPIPEECEGFTFTTSKNVGERVIVQLSLANPQDGSLTPVKIREVIGATPEREEGSATIFRLTKQTVTVIIDKAELLQQGKSVLLGFHNSPEKASLTALDISRFPSLTHLWCSQNKLTSLDVSKNKELLRLYCDGNQLTDLDVSKNTNLTTLVCHFNKIAGDAMSRLVNSLPDKW